MTATDELRRLLDERGVEYRVSSTGYSLDIGPYTSAYANRTNTTIDMSMRNLTPEQAIDATLGRGECHADETDTMECVCDGIGHYGEPLTVHVMECSACGGTYEYVNGSYEYCPRCGKKVVE